MVDFFVVFWRREFIKNVTLDDCEVGHLSLWTLREACKAIVRAIWAVSAVRFCIHQSINLPVLTA